MKSSDCGTFLDGAPLQWDSDEILQAAGRPRGRDGLFAKDEWKKLKDLFIKQMRKKFARERADMFWVKYNKAIPLGVFLRVWPGLSVHRARKSGEGGGIS